MTSNSLSTQPYKGARDFYPEDKRLQKHIFAVMRLVVERFGYEEYDAPIIEPLELYLAKTGEEIVNEQTYVFTDRGGRQVTLRPEMTPSVARLVAGKRQELTYPLRWYSIPNLWRYERPQRGRLREHWQLNVDIFGVEGIEAEHELILIADKIMRTFGAKREMYIVRINSRKLVDNMLKEQLGLDETQAHTLRKLIDRMHKMDNAAFIAETDLVFTPSQREEGKSDQLIKFLKVKNLDDLDESIQNHDSISELRSVFSMLDKAGISNAVFDPTLMRGFDYYTDVVFEVFDNHPENNRSMFGGGRYDGLVGLFGVEPVPTAGFGMGDVTLQNFLESHDLLPQLKPESDAYIVLIGDVHARAQQVLSLFRESGLRTVVDFSGRKPDKQLKSAIKKNAPYGILIGERELEDEYYMLKRISTGIEERHSAERIVSIIQDYRRNN
ncbi:histidine--tRNA ligase [soil metagenome]